MEATILFDEEITVKSSTPTWLVTCALLGFPLLLEPSAACADLVWGLRCSPPSRQCSNNRNDDGDRLPDGEEAIE